MWIVRAVAHKSQASGWRGGVLIATVIVLAALLAGASWSARESARQRDAAEGWRLHTLEVLLATDKLKIATLQAMRGERGYLLTGNPAFLEPFEVGSRDARAEVAAISRLTADNPAQQAIVRDVAAETDAFLARMGSIIALQRSGRGAEAIARVKDGEGRRAIERILADLASLERAERTLLDAREALAAQRARAHEFYQYCLSAIGVALLVLAIVATVAVRRAVLAEGRLRSELRRLAMFDELTGLANRREFFAGLEREIAGSSRTNRALAVAMLDIDHFKRVNDTWGHGAGDIVIRRVAELAVETMRGHDLVGRLGGEEFAIVMPGATANEAMAAGERLRRRIAAERIVLYDGTVIGITASTGVARFVRGQTADAVIARADEALYAAKNAGRDKVLLAA